MRRHLILAAALLVVPQGVSAQRHAAMPAAPHVAVSAPHSSALATVVQSATTANAIRVLVPAATRTSGNVVITINNNSGNGQNFAGTTPAVTANFVPVPGLGFDIVHLAATRGAAAVGALAGQSFVSTGIGFGGGELFIPSVAPTIVVQIPPIIIEQPVVTQAAAEPAGRPVDSPKTPAANPAPAEEITPARLRDDSEYVFVQRDGALFFAVAYSWENGSLHYVTRNGLRRTVLKDLLDLAATQKFNEQRGLSFRAPV